MAESNKIQVIIEAIIDDLKKGLGESKKELKKFAGDVDNASKDTDNLGDSAKQTAKKLNKDIPKSSKKAAEGLKDVAKGASDVVDGMKDLSGGKAGGVEKVASGFNSLTASATASVAIFAGLAAAVLAAGYALKKYGEYRRDLVDERVQWDRLKTSVEEYKKSLFGLRKVQVEGATNAAREVAVLKILKDRIDDTSLSIGERKEAISDLRAEFPGHFKDMSDEEILVGRLGGKYDSLTTSLINNAKARAALERIIELEKLKLTLNEQLVDNSQKVLTAQEKIDQSLAAQAVKGGEISGAYGGIAKGVTEEASAVDELNDLLANQEVIRGDIATITEKQNNLANTLGNTKLFNGEAAVELKKVREEMEAIANATPKVGISSDEQFEPIKPEDMRAIFDPAFAEAERLRLRLEEFKANADDILQNGLTAAVANTAAALGAAIAEGSNVLEAGGRALLGTIGSVLMEFGALVVAAGFAAEGLKAAITNWFAGGGAVAIVAGAALIAVGAAVSSFANNLGKKSKSSGGGRSYSGSTAGGGSYTPSGSAVRSGGSSSGGGTYVFEIEGTKLVGVLSNTVRRNKALGGSLNFG